MRKFLFAVSCLMVMAYAPAVSALSITPTDNANVLANAIFQGAGAGITITGVSYNGHPQASGTYVNGPLSIPDGSIFTSGLALNALPPNNSGSMSYSQNRPGHALCEPLTAPHPSRDANWLTITFDLAPGYDGVSFMFVFGSEEYPEYVNTSYNDSFGAYLNGQQVAFDNNGNPITINGPFFNSGNVVLPAVAGVEYDGSTPLLKTKAPLQGGTSGNTLTFIVCDAGDTALDSGAFVAGLSGCVGNDCEGGTEPCAVQDDDNDGFNACLDCNDSNGAVYPGAEEVCNGTDDDCDGQTDEGDVCCADDDLDDVCDDLDNCIGITNPDQTDSDLDGIGDACECLAVVCDDGNVCTDEFCDSTTGSCHYAANFVACNDNNACTANDVCQNGACTGSLINCDDQDLCTIDECDPYVGCTNASLPDADDDGICDEQDNCPNDWNGVTTGRSKIFVNNDEWTLTDHGFSVAPDATVYIANLCNWFTGGGPGNFLAYSTNFGLAGAKLKSVMAGLGHNYTVSTSVPFTVDYLLNYDAVFLGGDVVNQQVLIDYVKAGGSVYVMAGTGWGGAYAEAAQWNTFLGEFGLQFAAYYNNIGGVFATNSNHPVFNGVGHLYSNNGNTIYATNPPNPDTEIIMQPGLFAMYDAAIDGIDGQEDADGDGYGDVCDGCPNDAAKIEPGICGCGVADVDSDGDGTADCIDGCPADPYKVIPGACGCGNADTDTDGDGTPDCLDGCPNDAYKTVPGICGCGLAEECLFDGACLAEGEAVCANEAATATCANRTLVLNTCGTDYCHDTGDEYGAGTCSAVDYFCSNGVCQNTASFGTDTCGQEVIVAADLSTWTEESIGMADWKVSADKQSVKQWFNGDATFFYGDYEAQGGTLTGTISVESSSDDDFVGFVLGFQPGDTTNVDADYLLVDWKQALQYHSPWGGYAYPGLAISRVTGPANDTDFWTHTGAVEELQRAATLGNTGWQDFKQYEFRIEFSATRVKVFVNDSLELDVDGDFSNGRFGFYNLSQAYVSYAGLANIPVLSADAPEVTYYTCQNNNTCVANQMVVEDSCADTGTVFGGGACTAVDWTCENGALTSTVWQETDTCMGNASAPSVAWYTCTVSSGVVADTCTPMTTARADTCADTGDSFGGGVCAATDWTCQDGLLSSSDSQGTDSCGGTAEAPVLTAYSCLNNNTCVASETGASDSCFDTGDEFGGGSCQAVDAICENGVLSTVETSGTDTCGGSPDSPTVEYFSCYGNNTCLAGINTAQDDCVDTGNGMGGGACQASNWVCDGTNTFYVEQGDMKVPLLALHGSETVSQFYSYGYPDASSSNAGEETANRGNIYLYYDDVNSKFSLVVVLDKANDGSGGKVNMTIDGLGGTGTVIAVKDDPGDSYNLATGKFSWNWLACCTDGMALQLAGDSACLTFNPTYVTGINSWAVVSHNPDGTRTETIMPGSVTEPFTVCSTSSLHEKVSSGTDTCGGTPDAPNVTTYQCSTIDGIAADTCVAAVTAKVDNCVDTGSAFGGGNCSATDWSCTDGMLAGVDSFGTDTCGGNDDAPSVEYFVCSANDGNVADACAPATTTEFDTCSDSGDTYGGGTCAATDWDCTNGVLAATSNAGADTCNGTPDEPGVEYWVCSASDGKVADLCTTGQTNEADACSDTGDMWGGGTCAATDWDCEAGVLAKADTAGTDACGGDVDAPNVTFYSCNATDGATADACLSAVTQKVDLCEDSGDASGGGTCAATDWTCNNAILSSTSSEGIDTCGDGSDNQTYYYVCDAADGEANDLCVQVPDVTPPAVSVVLAEQAVLDDGLVVYQVYCDVADVCDDNPEYSSLIETPSPEGLAQRLKDADSTTVKFNLNAGKLDIFAPLPDEVLADLYEFGGIPIDDGQSVTIKTHSGEQYHYTYKVQEGIALIELKGPWVRLWCNAVDDAGNEADAYWEEVYHQSCGCKCQCDCPANGECNCNCVCEDEACACECDGEGNCNCGGDGGDAVDTGTDANQGVGNGPEGADPGNSNQGDDANSNDENGGTPGNPGKGKK